MKLVKLILRILLSPAVLIVTLFEMLSKLVLNTATIILNILSIVFLIAAVFIFFHDGWKDSLFAFVFAFIASPFGLPAVAYLLVEAIGVFKQGIKRITT